MEICLMTIQEIDAQIAQLKTRRAALLAVDRRPLDEWIITDELGLARRSLSLDRCRQYAVLNGTKLRTILAMAESAGVPIVKGETNETEPETMHVPGK
jgi:hypothetical protein